MVGPRGPGLCHFPAGPLWASSHLRCLRRRAFEVSFSDCDFRSTHHTTTVPGVCCGSPWHRLSALSGGAAGTPGKSGVSESTGAGLRWEEMRGPHRPGGGGGQHHPVLSPLPPGTGLLPALRRDRGSAICLLWISRLGPLPGCPGEQGQGRTWPEGLCQSPPPSVT